MRTRIWKCLGILVAFSNSAVAHADETPKCALPSGASRFYSVEELPETIRIDFMQRVGRVAAPKEDFNSSDLIDRALPTRRLIEIVHLKDRWTILYEVGGFAPIAHVVGYRTLPQNGAALFANILVNLDANLCRDGVRLLTDQITARVANDW